MEINRKFLAPCGLYCGVCAILYATREDNRKFKERLVGVYKGNLEESGGLTADDIYCEGCLSDKPFYYCKACGIRDCTKSKGFEGCHECSDWPCEMIENFPIPLGKKVILRAIPHWREVGTEQYVRDEEARYDCPRCGQRLFRGAKRCNQCKTELDLD